MLKVTKFGGSSMADAGQYRKVKEIVMADKERKVVVISAAGKRFSKDHKITDLLYLCHAHTQYGVECDQVFEMITSRYIEIRDELKLNVDLETEFAELKRRLDARAVSSDELLGKGFYSVYGGKVAAENDDELRYYVRGGADSWLDEIAQERWGDAVMTKPVSVEAMHQWLANNPEAFIAAFA